MTEKNIEEYEAILGHTASRVLLLNAGNIIIHISGNVSNIIIHIADNVRKCALSEENSRKLQKIVREKIYDIQYQNVESSAFEEKKGKMESEIFTANTFSLLVFDIINHHQYLRTIRILMPYYICVKRERGSLCNIVYIDPVYVRIVRRGVMA